MRFGFVVVEGKMSRLRVTWSTSGFDEYLEQLDKSGQRADEVAPQALKAVEIICWMGCRNGRRGRPATWPST